MTSKMRRLGRSPKSLARIAHRINLRNAICWPLEARQCIAGRYLAVQAVRRNSKSTAIGVPLIGDKRKSSTRTESHSTGDTGRKVVADQWVVRGEYTVFCGKRDSLVAVILTDPTHYRGRTSKFTTLRSKTIIAVKSQKKVSS